MFILISFSLFIWIILSDIIMGLSFWALAPKPAEPHPGSAAAVVDELHAR